MSQWVSEEFERNGRSVQVVDSVLRLGVGEGRLGANHRLGEEGIDDLSVRGHFPDDRERKTLDVRLQRAQICGDGAMVRAALEEGIFRGKAYLSPRAAATCRFSYRRDRRLCFVPQLHRRWQCWA